MHAHISLFCFLIVKSEDKPNPNPVRCNLRLYRADVLAVVAEAEKGSTRNARLGGGYFFA